MHETKNLCEKCEKPKIIYYGEWCPRCEKPKPETKVVYNLFRCMYYIEETSHPGYKDKFWKELCESYNFSNDTFLELHRPEGEDPLMEELFEKIGIEGESALFEISW